jgi:UDP-2,3-diacylglucosamine pyrophosphatase LpxH
VKKGAPIQHHLRALWLSDLHVGTGEFKLELLLDFLTRHRADVIYLAGDIVDFRWIGKTRHWPQHHERALEVLLGLVHTSRVVVLPGNHDSALRLLPEFVAGRLEFAREAYHETLDGRRLLVTHGDVMDALIRTDMRGWKIDLACFFYYRAVALEHAVNARRMARGVPIGRWVGALKSRLLAWRRYAERYRVAISAHAREKGAAGVVCGHIHVPEVLDEDGFLYLNTGDWIENCTAIAETHDGLIKLIRWPCLGGLALPPHTDPPGAAVPSSGFGGGSV